MATEEENQRNALSVLGTAIKSTAASTKVDTNQILFTLGSVVNWGFVPTGGVLDCQPVFNLLQEKGASLTETATVCLLLQRREDRLAVQVKLPTQVEQLSEDVRADLLANLPKQSRTGLTVSPPGQAPRAPPQRVPTAAGTPLKVDPAQAAAAAKVVVKEKEFVPPGNGFLKRMGISPGTIVLCLLVVAAGLGVKAALKEKMPDAVVLPLPAEYSYLKTMRFEENLYFYDPTHDFNMTKEKTAEMALALAAVVESSGAKRAYLCLAEEPLQCRAPKAVIRGPKVHYIERVHAAPK